CCFMSSVFICWNIRRQTRCTLFPYTTLFRSIPLRSCLGRWSRVREGSVLAAYVHPGTEIQHSFHVSLMAVVNHDVAHHQRLFGEDRKSTRLNSSHVKSSYAVFCLKKKK